MIFIEPMETEADHPRFVRLHNAELCTHARQDIPALVAEVERPGESLDFFMADAADKIQFQSERAEQAELEVEHLRDELASLKVAVTAT